MSGVSRRRFLGALGALALAPACAPAPRPTGPMPPSPAEGTPPPPPGVVLNDVHSKLNATRVGEVATVDSLQSLHEAVRRARGEGRPLSVSGGRHAMGGQQFAEGALHLDTRGMNRVLGFDPRAGLLKVEAGIEWPELVAWTHEFQRDAAAPWAIAQKQTGADRLTIGGTLAANAHGRGLAMKPIVDDVESFALIDASGGFRNCSRSENEELFRLVIGGYGLFGVIYSVRLRLRPRRKLRRVVEVRTVEGLATAFEEKIRAGFLYGDFRLETNEASDGFLRRGIFVCYEPVSDDTPAPPVQEDLSPEEWRTMLRLAHDDKAQAFELQTRYALATHGRIVDSDTSQLADHPDADHARLDAELGSSVPGSEMITELYVPRERLEDFLADAAAKLRAAGTSVIGGTVRVIERDRDTFLAWAKESWACTSLSLHVDHSDEGLTRAREACRLLIDLARSRGGSFFLTYHRWATREQLLGCYPEIPELLRLKRRYDPEERFRSEWYRHVRGLFA